MLVRALMSWLPIDEDGRLYNFIYSATEPVIMPVRAFLDRFEYVRNMPIDISFLAAYLLLSVVGMLLPQLR
jgi:YggT family protein